jgi:hypothetical protein
MTAVWFSMTLPTLDPLRGVERYREILQHLTGIRDVQKKLPSVRYVFMVLTSSHRSVLVLPSLRKEEEGTHSGTIATRSTLQSSHLLFIVFRIRR